MTQIETIKSIFKQNSKFFIKHSIYLKIIKVQSTKNLGRRREERTIKFHQMKTTENFQSFIQRSKKIISVGRGSSSIPGTKGKWKLTAN